MASSNQNAEECGLRAVPCELSNGIRSQYNHSHSLYDMPARHYPVIGETVSCTHGSNAHAIPGTGGHLMNAFSLSNRQSHLTDQSSSSAEGTTTFLPPSCLQVPYDSSIEVNALGTSKSQILNFSRGVPAIADSVNAVGYSLGERTSVTDASYDSSPDIRDAHKSRLSRNIRCVSGGFGKVKDFINSHDSMPLLYHSLNCGEIAANQEPRVRTVQAELEKHILTLGTGGSMERYKANASFIKNSTDCIERHPHSYDSKTMRSSTYQAHNDLSDDQDGNISNPVHSIRHQNIVDPEASSIDASLKMFQKRQSAIQHSAPLLSGRSLGLKKERDAEVIDLDLYPYAASYPSSSSQVGLSHPQEAKDLPEHEKHVGFAARPDTCGLLYCNAETDMNLLQDSLKQRQLVGSTSVAHSGFASSNMSDRDCSGLTQTHIRTGQGRVLVPPTQATPSSKRRKTTSQPTIPVWSYPNMSCQMQTSRSTLQEIPRQISPILKRIPGQTAPFSLNDPSTRRTTLPILKEAPGLTASSFPKSTLGQTAPPIPQSCQGRIAPSMHIRTRSPAALSSSRTSSQKAPSIPGHSAPPILKRTPGLTALPIPRIPPGHSTARICSVLPTFSGPCTFKHVPGQSDPHITPRPGLSPYALKSPPWQTAPSSIIGKTSSATSTSIFGKAPRPFASVLHNKLVNHAAAVYIRWEGPAETPQPCKEKCPLCRNYLSSTADGLACKPVAVLPCGHVFHDQCLQNITPYEQSKDPPCIPCVVGGDF